MDFGLLAMAGCALRHLLSYPKNAIDACCIGQQRSDSFGSRHFGFGHAGSESHRSCRRDARCARHGGCSCRSFLMAVPFGDGSNLHVFGDDGESASHCWQLLGILYLVVFCCKRFPMLLRHRWPHIGRDHHLQNTSGLWLCH